MNRIFNLIPYWILNFTIGFGWFSLAPIVPNLASQFSVGIDSIVFLITLYGYTMVAVALLSGYLSARYSVSASLISAAVLSSAGLFLRAVAPDYLLLVVFQVVAAAAYPLAVAPVGSIAQSIDAKRSHTIVGVSIGVLFLGMSAGSFVTPYVFSALGSVENLFLFEGVLSLIALATLPLVVKKYPRDYAGKTLKGSFSPGMIKNWYVGLAISSFSVMFGSIAVTELLKHPSVAGSALYYSGLLSGLAFLGSAIGAIVLPPIFEQLGRVRIGMVITSLVSLISVAMLSYSLAYTGDMAILTASYFMFGFFGNAFWSMAMTSTTKYVADPAQAGFSTSMYSVLTNVGVAFIPTALGSYFGSNPLPGIVIVSAMVAAGFALSFFLKVSRPSVASQESAETA